MMDFVWSNSEKKLARRLYDAALAAELQQIVSDFKARVAAVVEPGEMWALEEYLRSQRREIDAKYDYRYSQLLRVFGRLLREGRLQESELAGLSEDKLSRIRHIAS